MMLPTHALVGLAIAIPFAIVFPEFGSVALIGGLLGGIFPDLDLYTGHRKTLHFPGYFTLLAVLAVPLAAVAPTSLTIALAAFLLSAAVHSLMDILGGGLEFRPWEGSSNRAVYDHIRERWIAPRRWIPYDGAPVDFAFSVVLALPLVIVLEGPFRVVVVLAVVIGAVYTGFRRVLPDFAERLVRRIVPPVVVRYLPARYLAEPSRSS